jgi:glycine C-acetyltransferase
MAKGLMIYSAGWLAGYGVITGLVKEYDHIIMDQLSHNCLVEGARAATKNITRFDHLSH